jgi:GAF domain-containing protein
MSEDAAVLDPTSSTAVPSAPPGTPTSATDGNGSAPAGVDLPPGTGSREATASDLLDVFQAYSQAMLGEYDVGDVLHRLVDDVVRLLDVDGAGVMLDSPDNGLEFAAATDADIAVIEIHQGARDQGPCHEAFETGELVVATDLREEERWPEYRPVAIEHGCLSVVGIPMPVPDGRIGALNLYRHDAGGWDDHLIRVGQVMATMATGYIANGTRLEESRTLASQLQYALDSRTIIEQAKGVLVGQHAISANEAFGVLRSHARSNGIRLHDVCAAVVDGDLALDAP